jgi:hypothetical protein
MTELLAEAKKLEQPIVFLDEAVFTFNTFKTKAWASSYKSIVVRDFAIRVKT